MTKRRERSFHKTTMGKIIETLAKTHGWTLYIEPSLAQIPIEHIDQQGESDANLLTRMAQDLSASTFQPLPLFAAAAVLYLVINSVVAVAARRLEGSFRWGVKA